MTNRTYKALQTRVFQVLERAHSADRHSIYCDVFLAVLILGNLIAIVLESVTYFAERYDTAFHAFEVFSIIVFTIEYGLRLWSAPAVRDSVNQQSPLRSPTKARLHYVFSFFGFVDLISILPFYFQVLFPGLDLLILRVIRLLRIAKLSYYNTAVQDLVSAIYRERRAFAAAFYLLFMAIVLSSSIMYIVEGAAQPDRFQSIPHAMYWSLITITTVGYGDVVPVTIAGKMIAVMTAIVGVSVFAIMTGIIANVFNSQIEKRRLVFENRIKAALNDGFLDEESAEALDKLRNDLGLGKKHSEVLLRYMKDTQKPPHSGNPKKPVNNE